MQHGGKDLPSVNKKIYKKYKTCTDSHVGREMSLDQQSNTLPMDERIGISESFMRFKDINISRQECIIMNYFTKAKMS